MQRHALAALLLASACARNAHPVDPTLINPPMPRNHSILAAAPLTRTQPARGILPCDASVYHRIDGLTEGAQLRLRLRVETGSPYRFCHQAAFPDEHDQYSYSDLRGCAGENAPSEVSAEAVAEGPTLYVRVWRDGATDPSCIAARYTLAIE